MAQSKTSKAYWEQRQQALMAGLDKRDKSFSDKLAKDYQRQLNSIDKEIAAYYQQYGLDQTNDYRKMMIGLSDAERDNLFKNFDMLAAKDPKLAAMLPNRDSIYKLNRLEGMQMSLRMHMADLGALEESKMADYLKSSYDYGYSGTMKHLPNVPAMYHANSRVAEEMLNSKWFNDQNYSDRLWKNKDTLRNWLTQDLKDGLIRGTSYDDMSKQLAHRMSVGAFYAKRLVWTESSFMMNQGNKNAFIDDGLKSYEYSAILDGRTTPMCRELDGQKFEFKDYSPGLNAPPMHSFCRSMVVPIENELEKVAAGEEVPDPVNDEVDTSKFTEEDWYNYLVNKDGSLIFGEQKLSGVPYYQNSDLLAQITPEMVDEVSDGLRNTKFEGPQTPYNNSYQQYMYNQAKELGFDKKPLVIPKQYFDAGLDSGKIYRWTDRKDKLLNGSLEYSGSDSSWHGRAIYFGNANADIEGYGGDGMELLHCSLKSDATVVTEDYLYDKVASAFDKAKDPFGDVNGGPDGKLLYDAVAQKLGIDAYVNGSSGYVMVLNRGKLVVSE